MNELFAADPRVCERARDLQQLLSKFGPYTGRYLSDYPIKWSAQVTKQCEHLGDVEIARIKSLLEAAKKNLTLIPSRGLSWREERDWLENATSLLDMPAGFNGLITTHAKPPLINSLDSLDLPPTSEEKIVGEADEYARVAKILLLLSPEIILIDPFLNPSNSKYLPVLKALFELVAKGKSQKITLWARASVFGTSINLTIKKDIEDSLRKLASQANFKSGREVEMILVQDESQQTKMHGRYLLSIKGGIRLDQGFQKLPQGRRVDVGPIGKAIHNNLLDIYSDGKHDMVKVERIAFKL